MTDVARNMAAPVKSPEVLRGDPFTSSSMSIVPLLPRQRSIFICKNLQNMGGTGLVKVMLSAIGNSVVTLYHEGGVALMGEMTENLKTAISVATQ